MPSPIYVPVMTAAPVMDGKVPTESNWSTALKVFLGGGLTSYFRIGRMTDPATGQEFVYVGIYSNEFVPTMNARVVLGIQTVYDDPPAPNCAWKIHVTPFDLSVPTGTSLAPKKIEYWRNPAPPGGSTVTDWNHTPSTAPLPPPTPANAWLGAIRSWYYVANAWSMEMKIPVNAADGDYSDGGIWFPPAGTNWNFFVNLLSSPSAGAGGNLQRPWPATTLQMGVIDVSTPDCGVWGLGCF